MAKDSGGGKKMLTKIAKNKSPIASSTNKKLTILLGTCTGVSVARSVERQTHNDNGSKTIKNVLF